MPIIKSSSSGEDITVLIFNKKEIDSLVVLLQNAVFTANSETRRAADSMDELFYALGIKYPPEWQ